MKNWPWRRTSWFIIASCEVIFSLFMLIALPLMALLTSPLDAKIEVSSARRSAIETPLVNTDRGTLKLGISSATVARADLLSECKVSLFAFLLNNNSETFNTAANSSSECTLLVNSSANNFFNSLGLSANSFSRSSISSLDFKVKYLVKEGRSASAALIQNW